MSRPQNSTELVERYLQAVRFWVPKTQRHEGLIAELGEDLRSQIEEKENELGRTLDKAEISDILKRCGTPIAVAGRFHPDRYLIGPVLFPIYEFVLKMVLLWILVPVFIFIIGPVNLVNTGNWGVAVAHTLGDLWSGLFIAAGVVTLIFAILERTHAQMGSEFRWDPLKLPPVRKQERKVSRLQSACELFFGCFGLVWLLLLPSYPALIFGGAAAFLQPGSLWHAFYLPIVGLGLLGIVRSALILWNPEWTAFPQWTQLLHMALTLLLVNFMINASFHTPTGDWNAFVMVRPAFEKSAQYSRMAAIVNVSILISLASVWLGMSIALVIHVWQFLRYLRKRISRLEQPVSLQMQ